MAIFSTQNLWVFVFGVLGNIISFVVFLAPVPTFYRVWRRKSTEGFESLPYIAAQLSAMLWIYYASLKSEDFLLITINSLGCLIEALYIALYIVYAPKQAKMLTLKLLLVLNFGGFCSILLLSHFLAKGSTRVRVLGCICVIFSVIVFAAPLSVMRLVIRTKSVEFMPFSLSFFLTLNAIVWLLYGISLKDFYVALPNILGTILGVLQMTLYIIYKNRRGVRITVEEQKPDNPLSENQKVVIEISCAPEPGLEMQPEAESERAATDSSNDNQNQHLNGQDVENTTSLSASHQAPCEA